jgi:hypothetical protein
MGDRYERIASSDDLPDTLPNSDRRFARLSTPPSPQLDLGGKDDLHRVGFTAGNPQHPMGLHPNRLPGGLVESVKS